MKVNCVNAGLISFFGGQHYANLSGPTHRLPLSVWFRERECRYGRFLYFYCHALWLLLFVNFWRFDQFYKVFYPDNEKKIKKKTLNLWIDLVNLNVLFLRKSRELDFLCDCINGVSSPNVLKNTFIMLFS